MYHVLPHVGLPISSPFRTSSAAMRNGTDERRWLPCWNTMPVFRHVSRMISPLISTDNSAFKNIYFR